MKRVYRYAIIVMLLCCCISFVTAITVTPQNVPSTTIKTGDQVEVILKVSVDGSFNQDHDLWIKSDLTKQQIVVNDITDPDIPPRQMLVPLESNPLVNAWVISGFDIMAGDITTITIQFKGTVPDIKDIKNLSIVRMSEADRYNEIKVIYTLTREVINPALLDTQIQLIKNEVDAFKKEIDDAGSTGVNTAAALEQYTIANNAVNQAKIVKVTNITQAQAELNKAQKAIVSGDSQLEKAIAQYDIDQVEETMSGVESMVTFFIENRSMSRTDARLLAITNKYDLASQSLSSANEFVMNGNYPGAKGRTTEAKKFAEEAYNLSLSLKDEVGEGGFGLPGISPFYLAMIGVVIIVIGAVFVIYKKFFRWDELG